MPTTVLLVEDDESLITHLRHALQGQPVIVETAADASTAIAKLDDGTKKFCGLVLDLVLEDGSGFDVLRHLDRQHLIIPTVVVTQKLPIYVREMLDERHVKLVLPKPVDVKLLATIVLGLCGIQT